MVCDTSRIGEPTADAQGGGQVLQVQSIGQTERVFVEVGMLSPGEVMILA